MLSHGDFETTLGGVPKVKTRRYTVQTDAKADESMTMGANPPFTGQDMNTQFAWLRTRLSNERTLMSWNRTSLSLSSFGFTIYQFFERFQQSTMGAAAVRPEAPPTLGLSLMAVGTLGTLAALWQYHRAIRYLTGDQFKAIAAVEGLPHWSVPFVITVFLALIGLVATGWVLLRG
jgi:putative membrane protein